MKKLYLLVLLLSSNITVFSQEGFHFVTNNEKISIPFKLINNLMIIPVKINNVELIFLLDTGIEKTILFSIEETDSLQFYNIEKIKIRGLGDGKSIEALHSKKNKITIDNLVDEDHEIYIILDQEVNFSSQLGIPVHGILGYHFFKNNFIEIKYSNNRINVYKDKEVFHNRKLKKYTDIPFLLELEKPYIEAVVSINSIDVKTKLLVDTGASDPIWLFENNLGIKSPEKYFNDFLGRGFSGDVNGKRSRIEKFKVGDYEILSPTTSFPDANSIQNVSMVEGRNGSVGAGILKRFDIIFDYPNKRMYLKKNGNFKDPFNYNMSGIEFEHSGLQWTKEEVGFKTSFVNNEIAVNLNDETSLKSVKYQFTLKPLYGITNVRKNSPADLAGVKIGDIVHRINSRNSFTYKLQDINDLMQSEDGKWISLEVDRKGKILKFKFQLKKIL